MIIKKNSTPADIQKQIDNVTTMKRGFSQKSGDIQNNMTTRNTSGEVKKNTMENALELRNKISSLKNKGRF